MRQENDKWPTWIISKEENRAREREKERKAETEKAGERERVKKREQANIKKILILKSRE